MRFEEVPLKGAWIIDIEPHADERGFFARTFCQREFQKRGLRKETVQTNLSYSAHQGTLRGMHYQTAPAEEAKLVRCTRGRIFDVIIDVRPTSRTYTHWFGTLLSAENYRALYVPEGFAHGFLTLVPDCEVTYHVSQFYTPGHERGIRFDDQTIGIDWPAEIVVVSEKDRMWPDFKPVEVAES